MIVRSDPEHDDSMEGPSFLSLAVSKAIINCQQQCLWSRQVL
ncbi:hypothetical protein I314_03780 [Cryptococcus bacillisporus CA1873]|uniref:Uncharacterized protein n=2 Tax=Cryptococcus gattii TaxID=552467 RepID=A0A0D0VIL9_CRYGA|nr:hypothetical protein I312_03595 [Cryptococcus bacillisporus CA1280]KIR60484.1 hypothetical protein I314_03780 [Cryptococcus bacillisporus CA1873]|eukprot:KIR60484.1 hypothetical protein I314_03780 [Cryptococcus gattii CA1873]